jgi:hypothetical protein
MRLQRSIAGGRVNHLPRQSPLGDRHRRPAG